MKLDDDRSRALGLDPGHIGTANGSMRYTAGCIVRERERLARIFERTHPDFARAIRYPSQDDLVFKWNGPETDLDTPPQSVDERKARKATAK